MIQKTADKLGLPPEDVHKVLKTFYTKTRKDIKDLVYPVIDLPGIGSLEADYRTTMINANYYVDKGNIEKADNYQTLLFWLRDANKTLWSKRLIKEKYYADKNLEK